ncbi:hypothetical protein RR48_03165 [Papilio machaon]|uniref:Uncharacterized protein n=1 Tax=Papilio machaon TaxID=76193 RepID=A0A0N0PDD6_PAPMA|nr:hypothetical protein RR48_03165 [Papilio machaon]
MPGGVEPRAPDPAALAAYWAEYEDLCRQISTAHHNDDDDNHYEAILYEATIDQCTE